MQEYSHLKIEDRRQIYRLLDQKLNVTEIAQRLGRHRSTIYRELQRNHFSDDDPLNFASNSGYFPVTAQELYRQRREKLKKLHLNPDLKVYVIDKLKESWSPEQISGYLRRQAVPGFFVCYETIYQFIYSAEGKNLNLYRHLCRPVQNRRRRMQRKPRHLRGIPLHMSIDRRPDHINNREDFGHWEGDLMIFRG